MNTTIKKSIKVSGAVAMLGIACAAIASVVTQCRYCGYTSYGYCNFSPHGKHEHIDTYERCEFCGNTSYGYCNFSPNERHRHGHGAGKCIWCGQESRGGYCNFSPHDKHEL